MSWGARAGLGWINIRVALATTRANPAVLRKHVNAYYTVVIASTSTLALNSRLMVINMYEFMNGVCCALLLTLARKALRELPACCACKTSALADCPTQSNEQPCSIAHLQIDPLSRIYTSYRDSEMTCCCRLQLYLKLDVSMGIS